MRILYSILFLCVSFQGKTQQKIEVYPEDKCVEHVNYGAFLPANINSDQDKQTKKNLEKYRLDFSVEKNKYLASETIRVILSNKGDKTVELAVEQPKKEPGKNKCKSKTDEYFVWVGEQAEILLVRLNFLGDKKTIDPGQKIEFNIHLSQTGRYKFGLLTGDEAFGDTGLIVTPAFEVVAE